LQQAFWGGAQAGDESVCGLERLALAGADGDHLNDPAAAGPLHLDVIRSLLGAQGPGDVTAVADLMIHCSERDASLPEQLAGDLSIQGPLVRLDG